MRHCLALSLVVVAGCLDLNPVFVEPQSSESASDGGESTGAPPTTAGPTTQPPTTMASTTTSPTTDEGGATGSETTAGLDTDSPDTESPDTQGSTTLVPGVCGDGNLDPGEPCDDGNTVETDDCLDTCTKASCGDGEVWMDKEECDDGNLVGGDGCEPAICMKTVKLVFATSMLVTGDMGGIQGAHDLCELLAMQAGLPPGPYLAWLSDDKSSPSLAMTPSPYPYVKVNKGMVAMNWQQLTSGMLMSGIDIDENGMMAPKLAANPCGISGVHTNTTTNGKADSLEYHCSNWTSDSGATSWGDSLSKLATWTEGCFDDLNCERMAPIYCVQQ